MRKSAIPNQFPGFEFCSVGAPRVAGSVDDVRSRLQPVFAQGGYAGHATPFGLLRGCATRSPKGEAWWSQAGSNRRPLACHASALPAELWPLNSIFEHDPFGKPVAAFPDHAARAPWG